jgi:hypothetical protein
MLRVSNRRVVTGYQAILPGMTVDEVVRVLRDAGPANPPLQTPRGGRTDVE